MLCFMSLTQKGFRRIYNVNNALIVTGTGSLASECRGFKTNESYRKFITELSRSETIAQRKGIGLWKQSKLTWWQKFTSFYK